MKKIFFLFAVLIIAFSVSACTSKKSPVSEEQIVPTNTLADEDLNLADDTNESAPVESSVTGLVASNTKTATETPEVPVKTNKIMSPENQTDLTKTYSQAVIKTSEGNITVKFYAAESPVTVNNFLNLAQAGFYNGTKFHRIIKDFMIQGGDPLSKESDSSYWGTGGPDYRFKDEFNNHKLVAGSLAMANSGPNTNGSQFFIVTLAETPWLDGKHTNFGQVVSGMEIVKKIEAAQTGVSDRPVTDIVINSIELLK